MTHTNEVARGIANKYFSRSFNERTWWAMVKDIEATLIDELRLRRTFERKMKESMR